MRYTIKAGAGFSVITVGTDDAREALERAKDLVEQGMQNVVVLDGDGESRTPAEFEQLIGDGSAPEIQLS